MLAEETINELRSASGGMAPPLLLDVAYIEVLPRDHLTRVEEREVREQNSFSLLSPNLLCQAQAQDEERRIPSPDSTQSLVALDATKNIQRMDSTENQEMMESCSRTNQGLTEPSRRANLCQGSMEPRQRTAVNLGPCPTYNWHQPDFST